MEPQPGKVILDAGPVHLERHGSHEGVSLRPQMKVGYEGRHALFKVGVDDVRDGLSAGVVGQARRIYHAQGNSLNHVAGLGD